MDKATALHTLEGLNKYSDDPDIQVATIVVNEQAGADHHNALGAWNGWVPDFPEELRNGSTIIHAEVMAIMACARQGLETAGATMIVNWFPCLHCAQLIVGAEFAKVICSEPDIAGKWADSHADALALLVRAGIEIEHWPELNR